MGGVLSYNSKVLRAVDKNKWYRPSDWLPISHLASPGDQKIVLLVAVFPNTNTQGFKNVLTTRATSVGGYNVNWGDGSAVELIATNTVGEHVYNYENLPPSTQCSRGYRQAIVTITGVGNLTAFNMGYKRATTLNEGHINQILDAHIYGTHLATFSFYFNAGVNCNLLEHCKVYQVTNAMTSMANMFQDLKLIQEIEILDLNTENVINMVNVFCDCSSLYYIDVNNFNTTKVAIMDSIFRGTAIKDINVSNFNAPLCTNHANMFFSCINLTYVDLSSFDFSKTTNLGTMFSGCRSLKTVKWPNVVDLNLCTNILQMFLGCTSLEIMDFSGFINTNNIQAMVGIVSNCFNLRKFIISPSFDTSNLNTVNGQNSMFQDCYMIEEVNFENTNFNNSNAANATLIRNNYAMKVCRLPGVKYAINARYSSLDATNINLLFNDLANLNGAINTMTLHTAGTGYVVGNIITISAGNNDASVKVLTIGSGGAVATFRINHSGTGYSVATNLSTTGGTGTGFKLNITALIASQAIDVRNTPGYATCTPAIATAKNWTVT